MNTFPLVIRPYGETAILIEWPGRVEEAILSDILGFVNYLQKHCLPTDQWEYIPAYHSLVLISENKIEDFDSLEQQIVLWYKQRKAGEMPKSILWKIPVCYHEDFALDMQELTHILDLSKEQIIALHTSQAYRVYGIGFLPGFMYLGGIPQALETPRRKEPRLKVRQGSVGLAGKQTGIYPQKSPGGWNIIGNSPIPIFDVRKEPPCLVNIGDRVQFYAISQKEYELFTIQVEVDILDVEKLKSHAAD